MEDWVKRHNRKVIDARIVDDVMAQNYLTWSGVHQHFEPEKQDVDPRMTKLLEDVIQNFIHYINVTIHKLQVCLGAFHNCRQRDPSG